MNRSENDAHQPPGPDHPVPGAGTGEHGPVESPGEAPPGTVPPAPSMPDTSETMPPAEGVYAPEGDRPE